MAEGPGCRQFKYDSQGAGWAGASEPSSDEDEPVDL
jgi:hypothetical protein